MTPGRMMRKIVTPIQLMSPRLLWGKIDDEQFHCVHRSQSVTAFRKKISVENQAQELSWDEITISTADETQKIRESRPHVVALKFKEE